jgi:hypothetical protein
VSIPQSMWGRRMPRRRAARGVPPRREGSVHGEEIGPLSHAQHAPRPEDYPTRASYRWALRDWKRSHGGSLVLVLTLARSSWL